jgi:hypothetical protein
MTAPVVGPVVAVGSPCDVLLFAPLGRPTTERMQEQHPSGGTNV